jgi:Carbohydrate family 9 binding domain-like
MKLIGFFLFTLLICGVIASPAQNKMANSKRLKIAHIARDFPVENLNDAAWKKATDISVSKYWSGEAAPAGRHFTARLLWSDTAIYVRFEANQTEPLIVSDKPDLTKKIKGLWDRDVCEIFIAPDKKTRNKYFEFEIAPTGEWIDLGVEVTPTKRETDWDYASKMESSARIDKDKVVMAIRIPFVSLGKTPKTGDVWLGNLFRCVGKDPTRGYLAWQPTKTKEPAFHVPSKFGEFVFVSEPAA